LLVAGEFSEADQVLARGAELADTISSHEFAIYGEHPSMVCRVYGGKAKVLMGFPTAGARLVEDAIAHGRRAENAHSLAWALVVAAQIFQIHCEAQETARFASEAIDVARDHHLSQWLAQGERCMGWAMHQLGDYDAGMKLQLQGIRRWTDTGAMLHKTHCEVALAECFLRESKIVEARAHLDAARSHCASYSEAYLAAEIDRLEGLLLRYEQTAAEIIEEYLAKSMNTARRQGARLLELRTATTFARMLAGRDERRMAVDLLAPIYGWFTEGFDTKDLLQAKSLLAELG
jgi:predicted ATPase